MAGPTLLDLPSYHLALSREGGDVLLTARSLISWAVVRGSQRLLPIGPRPACRVECGQLCSATSMLCVSSEDIYLIMRDLVFSLSTLWEVLLGHSAEHGCEGGGWGVVCSCTLGTTLGEEASAVHCSDPLSVQELLGPPVTRPASSHLLSGLMGSLEPTASLLGQRAPSPPISQVFPTRAASADYLRPRIPSPIGK